MFKTRSKSLNISERDPTYKVKYLGNVLTAFMRGEGCVDRPAFILWNNYLSNPDVGIDMQLTVCVSGLKARTKDLGLTEYRAHRISYCVCHPLYPRLFIWVYRHEAKKMKVELRCHAVLCKNEGLAKAIAVLLHDKLSFALSEFTREKTRRQRARLTLQRANSLPNGVASTNPIAGSSAGVPSQRTKFLTVGQNFKPPSDQCAGAPKLGAISEDFEEETLQGMVLEDEVRGGGGVGHGRGVGVGAVGRGGLPGVGSLEMAGDDCVFPTPTGNGSTLDSAALQRTTNVSSNSSSYDQDARRAASEDSSIPGHSSSSSSSPSSNLVAHQILVINGELSDGVIHLEMGNDIKQLKSDANVVAELVQAAVDSDSDACSVESGFSE